MKGRLSLENFTGKTVESIKQDFWSSVFITNLESIMTADLEKRGVQVDRKIINKAVSFNAIKKTWLLISFTPKQTKIKY